MVCNRKCKITKWLKHLVAFIKDEMPHILEGEILLSGKSKYPSRSTDHDMRAFILQQIFMLPDVNSSIEDNNFNFRQIFAEPLKLVAYLQNTRAAIIKIIHRYIKYPWHAKSVASNLVSQFPCVAQYKCCYLTRNRVNLLERWKDKNCSLAHPRFCLAYDIHSKNCLRDALMLHWCGTKRNWSSTPVSKSVTFWIH